MTEPSEELERWFEKFREIDDNHHLLCPKTSEHDDENYKWIDDPESSIGIMEKKSRIQDAQTRIEITYWSSLIFGFDKRYTCDWVEGFASRLDSCLELCSHCILNWHMKRRVYLQKFSERWNEEAVLHIEDLLDKLDVSRIDKKLKWAKKFIEEIEATGVVFKKSRFGEDLPRVFIAIYDALCCVAYIAVPEQRAVFQFVFMRLQGKSYLKLGTRDPLPGMTFFLFDPKIEDRFKWAQENWKFIANESMTEEQFDWAVCGGLIKGIDEVAKKDLNQLTTDECLDIKRFWEAFEDILRTLTEELILSRLRSLEVSAGTPSLYDILFRHIQFCRSEAVLVITIRVLTSLLKKSPKAFWEVIGEAKPNVIADLIFGSPVFKPLLRQSLETCWSRHDTDGLQEAMPFPTSWIQPWLQSVSRDRRYDACEILLHTLFESLAKDIAVGEPGQAACIRAGFDALSFTMSSFLDPNTQIASGSTHLYACAAFNLVVKHRGLIVQNLAASDQASEGWMTFKVSDAARALLFIAMRLDMKLFYEEFQSLYNNHQLQATITRNSTAYWNCIFEVFTTSSDQISLTHDIVKCLASMACIEKIRPRKSNKQLNESSQRFNKSLDGIIGIVIDMIGNISEFPLTSLNTLFADRLLLQVIVGLSVHEEANLAAASAQLLKGWTGQFSRHSAVETMTHQHPEKTISSVLWIMERIMRPPFPWGPIRPLLEMNRSVLQGLSDATSGILRTTTIDSKLAAVILRWWNKQWEFVSHSCLHIENWSGYIYNHIMTEFCREIMELAEALIAEDGLLMAIIAPGKSDKESMAMILGPAKKNFRGMENMIRLRDRWLVDVTVRVLCKILTRLRENNLEIPRESRRLIIDACVPTHTTGRYLRSTNLNDQQRAELLQALGHDEEVEIIQVDTVPKNTDDYKVKIKKQSNLDACSKSASAMATSSSSSTAKITRSNREDVLELSKSLQNPILKQIEARQAKATVSVKVLDQKSISAIKESRQREKAERARRDAEAIARARQLRGETMPGGGLGSTHLRSEIMVNSSEEESDEEQDSDSDAQLTALSTNGQKTLEEHEKPRLAAMRDQLRRPVKKTRQQRSFKEMRARLIPSMQRLHNTVLAWNIFHQGNGPPSGPAASEVATKYADPKSYQETFFPLLASEAWRSFVTCKQELTAWAFGLKIASRASVDNFLEATFIMPASQNRERGLLEGDILLVSEAENPLANPAAKNCLTRIHRVTYKKESVEITYRGTFSGNPLSAMMTPGANFYGIKITNMTTIEREYAALESLQYYDLMDEILKAEPSPILRYGEERIMGAMKNWALNRGQALSVLGAQDNDGFTLIQGPPGTGKTKTIVSMVGSLLSDQLAGVATGSLLRPTQVPAGSNNGPAARSKKLLVCAPSNAAVDELVLRLKSGVKTGSGKAKSINVLRLGRSDVISAAVKDVTLDELVRARLEGDKTREKAKAERDKLHEEAAKIKEELMSVRSRMEAARSGDDRTDLGSLGRELEDARRRQMDVGRRIDASKETGNSMAREVEMRRRQVQQEIVNSAHVLCATLSGSGHEMFRNLDVEFETVIIDEAAQCVELSALIPLKYGCCKCILVGDPKQLPPTVLSQSAARFGYDQSLFVRMQQNHPQSVHLLNTQYRMHPEISMFPSREFYEGQLRDGQGMRSLRRQPWHNSMLFGPYRFFDVEGVEERGQRGQSLVNSKELELALQMYEAIGKKYRECDLRGKIGIITPYKAQLFELRSRFTLRFGESIMDVIEFNTTDAFQGRECEIIIFSCVRASATGGIGFMTDIRRMNVGLTRAKSSLWILGDSRALVQGEFWRRLIEDARARGRYTRGDVVSMFRRPLEQAAPESPRESAATDEKAKADEPSIKDEGNSSMDEQNEVEVKLEKQGGKEVNLEGPAEPEANGEGPAAIDAPSEMGEVMPRCGGGPPPIQSVPVSGEAKKRAQELSKMGQAGGKRESKSAHEKARGGLMAKFGQKASKPPPPAPKDASAMEVLGMTPPERPPARVAAENGPAAHGRLPTVPNKRPPATTANAPTARKKAKPSVFVPARKR